MHVFKSEGYLRCVELSSLLGKPPHFSEVEKEFPATAVVQHEEELVSSLKENVEDGGRGEKVEGMVEME